MIRTALRETSACDSLNDNKDCAAGYGDIRAPLVAMYVFIGAPKPQCRLLTSKPRYQLHLRDWVRD
jgi:hypothetical protein